MADTDAAIREARRQGHEEGREAERADIVEWLKVKASRIKSYTYGDADESTVIEGLTEEIEDGAHVGAAKKGDV